jgi:hypothetical protein
MPKTDLEARFIDLALANPVNRAILERLPRLGAPDAWLVAGSIYQAVWNAHAGRPADENVKDYDIFYCDGTDLTWEAEDAVIKCADALFADLEIPHEVRNQARVHLWYEKKFGESAAPLSSSRDGIARFLVACTCVGLKPGKDGPELFAPHGLDDLFAGRLRPNPLMPSKNFRAKAETYRARWPWLAIDDRPPCSPLRQGDAP